MDIQDIAQAISLQNYYITNHADEEAQDDQLDFDDIFYSVHNGEIIEDYPTNQPHPRCLIYGTSINGEPIHSIWDYNANNEQAILVTVYRPDPIRWINWRKRRRQ